jgi:hypothetical protein
MCGRNTQKRKSSLARARYQAVAASLGALGGERRRRVACDPADADYAVRSASGRGKEMLVIVKEARAGGRVPGSV